MGLFDNLDLGGVNFVAEDKELGSSKWIKDTGVYELVIKKAYFDKSASGAINFKVEFETEDGSKLNMTQYISNKSGQMFYIDKNGNKQFMPGYNMMRSLDFAVTGSNRDFPKVESKQIKLMKEGKEVIETKDVPTEWWNKTVIAMVVKKQENRQEKNSEGIYVDTPDWVYNMEVEHFANAVTNKTMKETIGSLEATFVKTWSEKFGKDYIRDARKIQGGNQYKKGQSSTTTQVPIASVDDIFG